MKCGKTTLTDEYELQGCPICSSMNSGIDNASYKRRDNFKEFEGIQLFTGQLIKAGNLHYNRGRYYALVKNLSCGTPTTFTNHAYIDNVCKQSMEALKQITPGTTIQFKARVKKYNKRVNKWGFAEMTDITPLHH